MSVQTSRLTIEQHSRVSGQGKLSATTHKEAQPAMEVVEVIRGEEAILRMGGVLSRFANRCGQPGAMQDLIYFLSKPGLLKRKPQLLLMFEKARPNGEPVTEHLLSAVLLIFEYRLFGMPLRMFTTNDRSGRNTLVALPELYPKFARIANEFLLAQGAHGVMMTFRGLTAAINPIRALLSASPANSAALRWTSQAREFPEYLPLETTLDATLAHVGQRTRSNMRYNRRRAIRELGCEFVPSVQISKKEFVAFNRLSMYRTSDKLAEWRYDMHVKLSQPLLMGMRDKDGKWLSLLGARRFAPGSEILWQMNREGLPLYSLGLVMRSFFLEHEIACGVQRMYIEGGTAHPIRESFLVEPLTDLVVLRKSFLARLASLFVRRFVPMDNELANMVIDPDLAWNQEEVQPPAKGQRGLNVRQRSQSA